METKSCELSIKKVSEGKVVATLARIGVRDRDGDVLRKGLLAGHQLVAIKPQHKWDHVNLGVADVYETNDGTMEAAMEFNMAIPSAKDWFESIRFSYEKGHRQQYSFGFETVDFEHGPHEDGKSARFLKQIAMAEVSPVLIGASVGSQTLVVKAFDDLPEPEMVLGDWDGLKAAGVRIQSLIFPKDKWDSADAVRSWLRSHDYSTELDSTGSSWRARQEEPGRFQRLRSFCINPGRSASASECRVMAVGGPMKESRGMEQEHPVIELAPGRWAVGVHSTEVDAKSWDTSIQVHRIHATGAPGYYRQIYAAQNPHADLTNKGSFAFPHHFIGADGEPSAASVRACAEGLVILQRYWNGLVPDEELKGIHAHLSAHLKDAGREPPELRSAGDVRYPLDDQIELVLWRLEDVLHQIDHVRDMRSRKGMALTEARLGQIDKLQQYFATLCSLVKIKNLDKPSDLVLQELSAEARAEAFGRRIEEMRAKVVKEAQDTEAAEIALRVQRWQHRLRG
jgi:hypothetical protein